MIKRTRVVFGSQISDDVVDSTSRELLYSVISLFPAVESRPDDQIVFQINPHFMLRGKDHKAYNCKTDKYANKIIVEEIHSGRPQVKYAMSSTPLSPSEFNSVTINREYVSFNSSVLRYGALYYNVDCYTNRIQTSMQAWGHNVVYDIGVLWSCPLFDINQPNRLYFPKSMHHIELTIEGDWLTDSEIMKIVKQNLPHCFLQSPFYRLEDKN